MSTFDLSADLLKVALQSAARAASKDWSLPILAGVHLSSNPNGDALTVAATDRYSLVAASVECFAVEHTDPVSATLSTKDLASVVKLLPRKGRVTLTLSVAAITVTVHDGLSASFVPVAGEFPDWRKLFPADDVIGNPVSARTLHHERLAILGSIKADRWVLGQALPPKGETWSGKPVIAVGNVSGVDVAVLLMPIRTDAGEVTTARETLARVTGRVSVTV